MKEMLGDCTFQGMQCFPSNFTRWFHALYGNCYTIVVPDNAFPNFVGPKSGLSLVMYTQDNEYIKSITSAAGFRVRYLNFTLWHGMIW